MTTTHDDDANSWRDLIDQLTPEQVVQLEYCEREQIPPGLTSPQNFLNHARKLAELNIARMRFAEIAPPADVIGEIDDWMDYDDNLYQRMFTSWAHVPVVADARLACGLGEGF